MAGRPAAARRSPLLVAALAMVFGFLTMVADPAAGQVRQVSVGIFDDDGGHALFPNLSMVPGRAYQECILVGASGIQPGDSVYLGVTDVGGALAQHLQLRVEGGQGGRFGDCSSFVGAALFQGTLAALSQLGQGYGVSSGWDPASVAQASFRITVWLPGTFTQQGLAASGRFVWSLSQVAVPDPTTTPTGQPTQDPTATATTDGPGATGSADPTTSQTSSSASAEPSVTETPTPTAVATLPSPSGGDGGVIPDLSLGADLGRLAQTADRTWGALIALVTSPQYPITAIVLAVAFLLVQDLIDRRDPKLAAVSRQRDNEVDFPDRFGMGRVRG